MALFEKFGEMNSSEELEKAAEGLLNEKDMESLKALVKENGLDPEDIEDWKEFGITISPLEAAVGKLNVEEAALKLPKESLIKDWIDYVRKMSMEDETIAKAVRTKNKKLADCIGKILEKSFANQWNVPREITSAAKMSASKVTFGIPSEVATRKLIREYYGGKA